MRALTTPRVRPRHHNFLGPALGLRRADLVVGEHIAAHQPGQAGQDDGRKAGRVIELGEIPRELRGPP